LLSWIHSTTGLPWWASIILATVSIRCCFVHPLATGQLKAMIGMQRATPELKAQTEKYQADVAAFTKQGRSMPVDMSVEHRAQLAEIKNKYGMSVFNQFRSALISMPVFLSFFWGLKAMAHKDPSFCTGGLSFHTPLGTVDWTNLAELDPTYLLPLANGLGIALSIHLNSENQPQTFRKFFIGAAVIVVPLLTANAVPVGVFFYWLTQSAFLILQGRALHQRSVRKFFGIPLHYLTEEQKEEARSKLQASWDTIKNSAQGRYGNDPVARSAAQASNPFLTPGRSVSIDPRTGLPTNPFAAPPPAAASASLASSTLRNSAAIAASALLKANSAPASTPAAAQAAASSSANFGATNKSKKANTAAANSRNRRPVGKR